MTPFERARAAAWQMRERLFVDDAEQLIASDRLIEAIRAHHDLDVEAVSPSSPSLASADAVLRRSESFIYVRNDLSAERTALFVAHELGHFVLDPDTSDVNLTSEALKGPGRSGGTKIVEAYGAHERKELVANTFARELLLPLRVARAAFGQGLSARQIADHVGLDMDVVRQQLLDALLLPEAAALQDEPPIVLTKQQYDAARATERFVNVVAGPGTGKTTCLVERARYLIEDQSIDPTRIVVLTFSNPAAANLVDRLRSTPKADHLWAGTFHAFGLEFLRKFHHRFNLPAEVDVVDDFEAILFLSRLLPTLTLQHFSRLEEPLDWLPDVFDCIKRLKEEMVDHATFAHRIDEKGASADRLRHLDVLAIYREYDRALHKAGKVDFVDLFVLPTRALEADRVPFSEYIDRYQHILVDEFQDVTEAMVVFLRAIAVNKSVWVVGDLRQVIYHWRGASFRSLLKFKSKIADPSQTVREYELTLNRRSTQQVVEAVCIAGEEHCLQQEFPFKTLTGADSPDAPRPTIHECSAGGLADALTQSIEALKADGVSYGKQLVLARSNADLESIAETLRRANVPVFYIGDLTSWSVVRSALCVMTLVASRYPTGLVGLKGTAYELSKPDIDVLINAARADVTLQRGGWLRRPPDELSDAGRAAVAILAPLLDGKSWRDSPWEFLCDLLLERRFLWNEFSQDNLIAKQACVAFWQFIYCARSTNADGSIRNLSRFLLSRRIRQRINKDHAERNVPPYAEVFDAVSIRTLHGSKGLEAEAVHLVGMSKKDYGTVSDRRPPSYFQTLPYEMFGFTEDEYQKDAAIERNNLLFVALSRARRHLHGYTQPSDEVHKIQPYTRLLQVCDVRQDAATTTPSSSLPSSVEPVREHFDYVDFLTYVDCPLRFHYRRTLRYPEQGLSSASRHAARVIAEALALAVQADAGGDVAILETTWSQASLPTPLKDPGLWDEAKRVFERSLARLRQDGHVIDVPSTTVSATRLTLPWMLRSERSDDLIWLVRGRLTNYFRDNVRPLMNEMSIDRGIVLYGMLDGREERPTKSGLITSTTVYKVARKNERGDIAAREGYTCRRCGYALFCPSLPEP